MKRILFFLLLTSVWGVQAQSLEQILTRNEKAVGGRKNMESFQSFKAISKLEEFGSYVADTFTSYFQREGKIAVVRHALTPISFTEKELMATWRGSKVILPSPKSRLVAARLFLYIAQRVGQTLFDQSNNFKKKAMK